MPFPCNPSKEFMRALYANPTIKEIEEERLHMDLCLNVARPAGRAAAQRENDLMMDILAELDQGDMHHVLIDSDLSAEVSRAIASLGDSINVIVTHERGVYEIIDRDSDRIINIPELPEFKKKDLRHDNDKLADLRLGKRKRIYK